MKCNLLRRFRNKFEQLFKFAEEIGDGNKKLDTKFYTRALHTIWWILSILVLALGVYSAIKEHTNPDIHLLFLWALYIINFPSSILCAIFVEVVFISNSHALIISSPIISNIFDNLITWCVISFFGYLQWSLVLPKVINRILK